MRRHRLIVERRRLRFDKDAWDPGISDAAGFRQQREMHARLAILVRRAIGWRRRSMFLRVIAFARVIMARG